MGNIRWNKHMGYKRAKGWEKSSLLDSESLGTSYSAGDWVEWDVTLAVQNAMREDRSVDLILGILGSGSGNNRDALFYPNSASSTSSLKSPSCMSQVQMLCLQILYHLAL